MLTINSVSGTKYELFKKEACANGSSRFMVKLGIGWLRHFFVFSSSCIYFFYNVVEKNFLLGRNTEKSL